MNALETFTKINNEKDENSVILICGSVFIMEHVRDAFGVPQHKDGDDLNSI